MKKQILKRVSFSRIILLTLILKYVSVNVCNAQFIDNFSDGDFTSNPAWTPDISGNWTIQTNQLRSNVAIASSTFYITTPSLIAENAQWEFLVNLQFNTSSANFVDVFLMADRADLKSTTINGYFVRIGGTPDEISLYKIVSGVSTMLINGTDGITNFSNNLLRIKITRNASNNWELKRDATGGTNYVLEGIATDNTFNTSSFFGIKITQSTATFFNKHFFDDFYVGDIITDTTPPEIQSVNIPSSNQLNVVFTEKVERASAENLVNYTVNNNVGQPMTALLQADEKTVRLTFLSNFPNISNSTLTIIEVADLAGNAIGSASISFFYFDRVPAQPKDIIITEIFADPNPKIGLPEAEFLEIYNRSTNAFDLLNWKITDGTSTGNLPAHVLLPGEYIILTSTSTASLFSSFGTTLSVPNFPTLNNSGDNLMLKSPANEVIDQVQYADSWYRDDDKKQGGWTLELIDPENICAESDNWVASENKIGGTPGTRNSVFANKPDVTGPQLVSAIALSPTQVKVIFNEKLDKVTPTTLSFAITPSIDVTQISFASSSLKELLVDLATPLQSAQAYAVTASNVYDCAGNLIQSGFNTAIFGLPEEANTGDVLINEILFNPRPFGVDFVELYNASDKFINLKNWIVGNYAPGIVNTKTIISNDFLLHPHQFLVITTDALTLQSHYPQTNSTNVLKVNALPAFPDDAGSVAIQSTSVLLDYFIYDKSFHSPFLKDKEGVSLERISITGPTNDLQNWQSANATSGFATPGYQNSNSRTDFIGSGSVVIDPELFEPVSGQPNSTQIHYNFNVGGFVANVKILDAQGHDIKEIARQVTLGTEGFFKWEGDRDDGTKARRGYYFVWVEVFNASGQVETFRKRVVVTSRF